MRRELEGTVSLVTGAASGIGRATALELSRQGSTVAALDRDEEGLARLAADLGDRIQPVVLDLSAVEDIRSAVSGIVARSGRLDHLVNCAGVTGPPTGLLNLDLEAFDAVYTVNVKAPLLLMHAAAAHMVQRGGGGRIVNVTSSSAFRARMSVLGYSSSKAALGQITRSAAAELGRHGITVNAVAPGVTRSAMTSRKWDEGALQALVKGDGPLGNLLGRVSEPEDVAEVVVFLCLPGSKQITAQTIHTSAGAVV
jgi:NAD(P)-dependent dehydrogenase (short-subunit alcohol dehydrogenase family)